MAKGQSIMVRGEWIDYLKERTEYSNSFQTAGGWASASDESKLKLIDYFLNDTTLDQATNDSNKVTFLITQGIVADVAEASDYLTTAYAKHNVKEIEACRKRAESENVRKIVATYLELPDAADFVDTTKTMIQMYKDNGIKGTQYGTVGEGLMDFIESTPGTSFEFIGLAQQGYVCKNGLLISGLISGLVDILINGNYSG